MILLDTHAWVWWVASPDELSPTARTAIEHAVATSRVLVSSISVWEVALLAARSRLRLSMPMEEWVEVCESIDALAFVPVDNHIALRSVALPPPLHADPADRIIAATAVGLRVPLVTKDERLLAYQPVETVW